MKKRLKIIFILSLTMIASLMGIIFSGTHLNNEYQNFNLEMRKHIHYSRQMTSIAIDLNKLQFEESMALNPKIEAETENTRYKLIQLLGQVDKELQLLTQRSHEFDSIFLTNGASRQTFRNSIGELKSLWYPFREAILIIADGNFNEAERFRAINYIENNFDALYSSSDKIAEQASEMTKEKDFMRIVLSCGLLIVAFSVVIIQFIYIFRQVILPLEAVYKEIKLVGVSKMTVDIQPSSRNKHVYPIIHEINFKLQKLGWLISMIQNVNKNENFYDVLQFMYTSFSAFIPLNHIGIALIEDDDKTVSFAYGISDQAMAQMTEKMSSYKVPLEETSLQSILDSGKPRVIEDLVAYVLNRPQNYYNHILLQYGIKSSITIPLKINNSAFGFVFFSSKQVNAYNEEHAQFLEVLADSIAISFNKNIIINEILYGNSLALAKLAESRDHFTGEHLIRIKTYTKMITQFLATDSKYKEVIDYRFIQDIEKYSELHDIGKVAIEDGILLKPGKLTELEFEIMKKHTLYGGRVLRDADASIQKGRSKIFQMGIEIAECHHEKWNGGGYPHGISGDSIPLSARIVAAADVFDALTSERPYKRAFSFEDAFKILQDGRSESFDPEIIDVMIKNKSAFEMTLLKFKTEDATTVS